MKRKFEENPEITTHNSSLQPKLKKLKLSTNCRGPIAGVRQETTQFNSQSGKLSNFVSVIGYNSRTQQELFEKVIKSLGSSLQDPEITFLDLNQFDFRSIPSELLIKLISCLENSSITHFNLSHTFFEIEPAIELTTLFSTIPSQIIIILTLPELKFLHTLKTLDPNRRILLANQNNTILYPCYSRDYANQYRKLGLETPAPSLRNMCAFFVAKNPQLMEKKEDQERIPSDVLEFIDSYKK